MKRTYFKSDQPSVERYGTYKRQNTNDQGWRKNAGYDKGDRPIWGKNNQFNNEQDKVSPTEFAGLKYKHGSIIAFLIGGNQTIFKLRQKMQSGDANTKIVLKELEEQRKLIIEARPNATKYIHLSFYLGLRVSNTKEDPETGKYESDITYQGGAQVIQTRIVHSESELDRYCGQIDEILANIQTVNDLKEDETLNQIKKRIALIIGDEPSEKARANASTKLAKMTDKAAVGESGNEADDDDDDELVLKKERSVPSKVVENV